MKDAFDRDLTARALQKLGAQNYEQWLIPDAPPEPDQPAIKEWEEQPLGSVAATQGPPVPAVSQPVDERAYSEAPVVQTTPVSYSSAPASPEPERSVQASAPAPPPEPSYSAPPPPVEVPPESVSSEPNYSWSSTPPSSEPSRSAKTPSRPAASPTSPTPAFNEDGSVNPSGSTRALQAGVQAANQREVDLVGERAEAVEATASAEREVEGVRAGKADESIKSREARAAEHKKESDDIRAQMQAELADLKQQIGNPPRDTMGMIMGIVSVIAAAGGKGEAAKAVQMLGQVANTRMRKWEAGIQAGERNLEGMGKIATYDRLANADEDEAQALIDKAWQAEAGATLDHLESQAKSQKELNAIQVTKNGLERTALQNEVTRRQKAAAAARLKEIDRRMSAAGSEEEKRHIADEYGPDGRKIYQDRLKTDKAQTDVAGGVLSNEAKAAETQLTLAKWEKAKKEAADAGKPAPSVIPGRVSTVDLPNQAATELFKMNNTQSKFMFDLERLIKISEEVQSGKRGKFDANTAREIADIRNGMVPQKTQMHGAGSPTGKEYDTTMETTADPQQIATRADVLEVLKQQLRNARGKWDRVLRDAGQLPAGEATGTPAPRSSGLVRVFDKDGNDLMASPTIAQSLVKRGGRMADEEPAEQ